MRNRYLPELLIWLSALVLLFLHKSTGTHMTVCPLALVGAEWCPGCGLGRSISLLLHGELSLSIRQHPLGLPALLVLMHRIVVLSKKSLLSFSLKA